MTIKNSLQRLYPLLSSIVQTIRINKILVLILLCIALYLPGISSLPATDRDESRYMQASKQMLASGNMIDIRFQQESRHKKPVGIYWLQSGAANAAKALGIAATERSPYRLPSTLGATFSVLLLYLGFRKVIGDSQAFFAAVLLACSLLIAVEAHLAKTDAMLLATIVCMQTGLAQLYCNTHKKHPWTPRLLFWLGLSLAMLIKGPVAPILAFLTLAWICWKEGSLRPIRAIQPLPWLLVPLLVVGPWLLSIQLLSNGSYLQSSIGQDFFAKILQGQESHGAPPGTYLLITPLLLWPACWLLIPQGWVGLKSSTGKTIPATQFMCGWLIPNWIFLELVPTKLPHYVLPLIPSLCLLAGVGIVESSKHQNSLIPVSKWPQKIGMATWAISGTVLAIAIPGLSFWSNGTITPAAILISLLCIATLIVATRITKPIDRLLITSLSAALTFGLIFEIFLPQLSRAWPAEHLRKLIDTHGLGKLPVSIMAYHEPSVVFNLGTDTNLTDFEGVVSHSKNNSDSIVIVPSDQTSALKQRLEATCETRILGKVEGVNYSKGRNMDLNIIQCRHLNSLKTRISASSQS